MEAEQEPSSSGTVSPVQDQSTIKTWRTNKRVSTSEKTPAYLASRFQGDGVRYKAKLIGVDEVTDPTSDKLCLDAMMKLKGREVAARQRGQHKQRVWLKVSVAGVRIIDEKTGAVEYEHGMERISSLKKDESDPRAFSYVYGHEGFKLFFLKMANAADPVIEDFKDVCLIPSDTNEETKQTEQNGISLLLDEQVASPQQGLDGIDLFSPAPCSPTQHSTQTSCHDELFDIFSNSTGAPAPTNPNLDLNQAGSPQSPWASPAPYSATGPPAGIATFGVPTTIAWEPQRQLGTPLPSSLGPWGTPSTWAPQRAPSEWVNASTLPYGGYQPPGTMTQPGGAWGQTKVGYPAAAGGYVAPGREGFSPFGSPNALVRPVLWQNNSSTVSAQVSSSTLQDTYKMEHGKT